MFTMNVAEADGGGLALDLVTDGSIEAHEMLGALETETPPSRYQEAEGILVRAMNEFDRIRVGVMKGYIARPAGWPKYQTVTLDGKSTVTIMEREEP